MVTAIAWSPDGKRIASASNDETIQVWQLDQDISEVSDGIQGRIDPSDSRESFIKPAIPREHASVFRIRIVEDPLTPTTLISLLSAMTDLVTKCWLIGQGRFADLMEYTQTRDRRFVEETQLAFTRITYNSPFEAIFKVDLSAPSVAEGIKVAIDAITQIKHRIERAELENQEKAQELENVKQRAQQENASALLEKERQQLALERERLEILEKRLDVQKKGITYALEIAAQTVMVLHPGSDEQTKAMLMQALLPTILQLQNGKNLELSFPALQIGDEDAEQDE
ncbi:hypothetical protein KSD_42430 [Ktedonobacter sp. SOSP1-85]|nr:hypothetical protein KSD_42430 [Ktedonobacter sp. SOSP1-85]